MLKRGVGSEHRVVGLNDRVGESGCRIDAELELGLLAVVGREALEDEGAESRSGSATEGVEDKEALETRAVVRKAPDLVHDSVNLLLANSVMATRI